jgi:mannan endo-1,6-alpha-mannosidase
MRQSNSQTWVTRTQNFFNHANSTFFQSTNNGLTVYEPICSSSTRCTNSQRAYKALLVRWMARTAMAAPFTTSAIQSILSAAGKTVAAACTQEGNSTCTVSGNMGLGEQMAALDLVQGLLVGGSGGIGSGTGAASTTTATGSAKPSSTGKSDAINLRTSWNWATTIGLAVYILLLF